MAQETVQLGPQDAEGGLDVTAIRVFDIDETDYYHNYIRYELTGVESISMDPPETVGFEADNLINVEFVNGKGLYFMGVITDVE